MPWHTVETNHPSERGVNQMERKTFGVVDVDVKAAGDDESGDFEAVLSAPTIDRDGEIIDAKAFDPLPDHITIDIDHGLSVSTTVGSGAPYYDGDLLKVKGSFSSIPRAQEVRQLVREGHIRKMSVAFFDALRETDEKDGKPHIRKAELLNAAFVPVPANREASILAAKALAEKVGARNSTQDAERLQAIHDYAVENGAACATKAAHEIATASDPEQDAAPAASSPADGAVAKALAALAEADIALID